MKLRKLLFVTIVLPAISLQAQFNQGEPATLFERAKPVTLQTVALPSPEDDSIWVFLIARVIPENIPADPETKGKAFKILWEFRDTNNFIVRSILLVDTIPSGQTYPRVFIKTTKLPSDHFSMLQYVYTDITVDMQNDTLPVFQHSAYTIYKPIPIEKSNSNLEIAIAGTVFPFLPKAGNFIIPLKITELNTPTFHWRITRVASSSTSEIWSFVPWEDLMGEVQVSRGELFVDMGDTDQALLQFSVPDEQPLTTTQIAGDVGFLYIPVSPFDLYPGTYRLELQQSNDTAIIAQFFFRVHWYRHPLSLLRLRDAQRLLALILKKNQQEWLRAGSQKEQILKFHSLWQYFDPTPQTRYNEALAEFYTRADYALFHLRSDRMNPVRIYQLEDRQKIYIAYGPPDDVQRIRGADTIEEVWIYKKPIGKVFRFVQRNGTNFRLVEENDL